MPASTRRLLDVGCWKGAFGAALKARRPGLVVWAVETDPAAAEVAAERLDRVLVGSFPDAVPPGERFDAVTFVDVLEHFADPWTVLRRTAGMLTPTGVVVAAIPNVRHFRVLLPLVLAGRWDYTESGLLDRTHLRFFTRATMLELFADTGYEVEECRPVNLASRRYPVSAALSLLGSRGEEFRALQYVVVARPASAREEAAGAGAPAQGSG